MSDISQIQKEPDQMKPAVTACPVSESKPRESRSFTTFVADHRRYRLALGVSLAILFGVLAFGFYVTLP